MNLQKIHKLHSSSTTCFTSLSFRKQPSKMFFEICVPKTFAIFTRKHLRWSLFRPATSLKRNSNTGIFLFYTPLMPASIFLYMSNQKSVKRQINNKSARLTNFKTVFYFFTGWKRKWTNDFLTLLEGMKVKHWLEFFTTYSITVTRVFQTGHFVTFIVETFLRSITSKNYRNWQPRLRF